MTASLPNRVSLFSLGFFLFATSLSTLAAGNPPKKRVSKTVSTPSAPKAKEPIYDTEINGKKEIAWKIKVCTQSNRKLLINFGTNDCELCHTVNKAMHERKFFEHLVTQFVPVFVDVTPGTRNAELLKDYAIDPAKGLPAMVILDHEGKFEEATNDGEMVATARQGDEAVRSWILKHFEKDSDF